MVVYPAAPLLEVVRPALVGDSVKQAHLDSVVQWDGDVADLASAVVNVPSLDVTTLPADDTLPVFPEDVHDPPSGEIRRHHPAGSLEGALRRLDFVGGDPELSEHFVPVLERDAVAAF